MADQFFPVTVPPGFVNNGTQYQSKGRWWKGNFVRFFQGNKQPIGGWVKRTLSGATIVGTPLAMARWTTSDGIEWLAVGTSKGAFVIDSSNVVYDITPGGAGNSPWEGPIYGWSLTPFGSYLILRDLTDPVNNWGAGTLWCWTGSTGTPFDYATIGDLSAQPTNLQAGAFATGERFLMVLSGQPDSSTPDYPAGYVP